ncbi:MAG: hypothetical protein ACI3XF_03350 [Eubacteriales bacterium]
MRKISADITSEKGKLNRFFAECIGAGRAGEVMRYVPMEQLKKMQRECPFRYIRFHGIFHEEMNVVRRDENGKLSFCFQYVDMIFDSLLENGIRPICELGLMPATMANDEKTVFWWKMNICMPQDIGEWASLIEAFVTHLTDRYGAEEIKQWYFEVWNEPNHKSFFSEYQNINAYFELYDTAARAVKKVCSEYRVGGPATAGMVWVSEMIEHCRANGVPLDFITSHSYGVKGDFDEDGTAITVMKNVDKVSNEMRHYGEICHKAGLPLIITEWSSSYSNTDPIHDHYFGAVYVLRAIKRSEGYADMFSYWTYTDIFEENSPLSAPFTGCFGLMTMQSIQKPVYNAYTFLHALGDTELACDDEEAYVCKSENGVQALYWNLSVPQGGINNKKYFSAPISNKDIGDAVISICGFEPNREYSVVRKTIGYGMGDALTAYRDMGSPIHLSREQTAILKEKAKPQEETFTVLSDAKGKIEFALSQRENQVDLVEIML